MYSSLSKFVEAKRKLRLAPKTTFNHVTFYQKMNKFGGWREVLANHAMKTRKCDAKLTELVSDILTDDVPLPGVFISRFASFSETLLDIKFM